MHAVGRLGPARQFFSLKVRRQESSKSAGRCSTLGKGTEEKKLAGRAQPGQSRAGAGLPAGHAGIFLGIALMLLGRQLRGDRVDNIFL